MHFKRSSGVLLHVTSLASHGGIGDLGPAAHDFVSFLASAKQHVWQVLPLCPTGYGNSPYAGSSAFAGNPYLISLELLADWGWIAPDRIASLSGPTGHVDFDQVEQRKLPLLREAAGHFLERAQHDTNLEPQWKQFIAFCQAQSAWLADYALYAVLRREFSTGAWTAWPDALRKRDPLALTEATERHAHDIAQEKVLQFAFSLQWELLRKAAACNAIRILGDVAIFVNMDSSDVWVHPELFELDENLNPIRIAGVPPDYFSPTGQRWAIPSTAGTSPSKPASPGGLSASVAPANSTTSSASTISVALKPIGPFPPKKKRPSKASGSRLPAASSFMPFSPHWDRCLWSLKILASSRPRLRPCALACRCPA